MEALDGVGGIDQPAQLRWIAKAGGQLPPITPPGLGTERVLLPPDRLELRKADCPAGSEAAR